MKKLQQFFQLKLNSSRLKKAGYNINMTLDEARQNSEVISVNNSELLRRLFKLNGVDFSQELLEKLFIERKNLRKSENNDENRQKLLEINEKIEKMLYIEDIITVEFENKSHYREIIKRKGFYVNNKRYIPFMASAGMIRKSSAMFMDNNKRDRFIDILQNDRNEDVEIVPAKWGAYLSLYSSSTLPVSFPRFAVVPDKTISTTRRVDFVTYKGIDLDDDVTEKDYTFEANAFDGQGLITPEMAEKWSKELGLDYTFSAAIVRAPFLKGLVVAFDLKKFAEEVAHSYKFTDAYGDEQDIREIDLVVSESQFKLLGSYKDTEEYVNACHKNGLGFGIAKVNPKQERAYSRTSYQFLQVLNLSNIDVANLCEPTINWIGKISGDSANDMILYATGENVFEAKDFRRMDVTTKAVMLNPALAHDKYVQSRFIRSLEKKKKESFMGSLLVQANYQFMIADPFYQAAHIFALTTPPLLEDGQHYSEYWQNKGINKVVAVRSPIVHHSEVNILNLQNRDKTKKWYAHIHSGIIFPAYGVGIDWAIHGGADADGDLICTINNNTMIRGRIPALPIFYESHKAKKEKVNALDDKKQAESQMLGHNSKVGFATNISSSLYALLEEFPVDSPERKAIENRLKIGRVIQGEIIDSVKGLQVPPFRDHWTKYKRVTDDMPAEEKELQTFYNKILCEIRPAFFRFLYPKYMSRYNKEIKKYNIYSRLVLKKDFLTISSEVNKTEDEVKLMEQYRWNSFFLNNTSVVNRVSEYMRKHLTLVWRYSNDSSKRFDYNILMSKDFKVDGDKLSEMIAYLQHYKSFKRGMWHDAENTFENTDSFVSYLRKECYKISSNDSELASYAVLATYANEVSMVEFVWKMFPVGLLQNIQEHSSATIKIPVADPDGDIEYLWTKYSIQEISLEDFNK